MKNTAFKIKSKTEKWVAKEPSLDSDWDRGDTSSNHTLEGVNIVEIIPGEENFDFDCVGAFEAGPGDDVFLVSVVYSTGDSFGWDDRAGLEFIEVFKTLEKAERCKQQIEASEALHSLLDGSALQRDTTYTKKVEALLQKIPEKIKLNQMECNGKVHLKIDSSQMFTAFFQNEKDELRTTSTPWFGSFCSLDYVSVQGFTLETGPEKTIAKRKI